MNWILSGWSIRVTLYQNKLSLVNTIKIAIVIYMLRDFLIGSCGYWTRYSSNDLLGQLANR